MKPYYLNDMCLPSSGRLKCGGFETDYTIAFGSQLYLGINFVYVENDSGHALQLANGIHSALHLLDEAKACALAVSSFHQIRTDNENPPSRIPGYFVLATLLPGPGHASRREVIIFITESGYTFQHYSSNMKSTDEEVREEFAILETQTFKRGLGALIYAQANPIIHEGAIRATT